MMMMMMIAWMMTPTTLWMHCMMMASGHSSVVCREPYPIVCCVSTLQTIFLMIKNIFTRKNILSIHLNKKAEAKFLLARMQGVQVPLRPEPSLARFSGR